MRQLLSTALVACLVGALAGATASAVAQSPDPSDITVGDGEDWIVFQWDYPEKGLYLIMPDGSGLHRLAPDLPGEHIHPTWAPDGQRIAFTSRDPGDAIWIVNADGTEPELLYECKFPCVNAIAPDWSPDGGSIFFSTNEGPSGTFRLMRHDLASGTTSEVLSREREPTGEQARVSPDGRRVVYTRFDDLGTASGTPGSSAIFVADVAGGDERQLTDWEIHASHPDWGPDGTILFTTYDLSSSGGMDVPSDLYTIAPDGSELRRLTMLEEGVQRATQPRWTPDGTGVVFTLQEDPATIPDGFPNKNARRLAWISPDGEGMRYATAEPVFGTHPEMRPVPIETVGSSPTLPVLPVDWIATTDDSIFEGDGGHMGGDVLLDVALAPSGEAVIVGFDGARAVGDLRDGLMWWSASGDDWRKSSLPDALGARPRRVVATKDGFVAIGQRWHAVDDGSVPTASVWTSSDGIDWSGVTFEHAEFADVDSVDDRVAILGTSRNVLTVWTSRSGGPWEQVPIAEGSRGFLPAQLAVSADGVYLVRDRDTGLIYRSDDGIRFTPVDLPEGLEAGDEGRYMSALTRVADGFALVLGPVERRDEGMGMSTWLSPDGREWRRGEAAREFTDVRQLGFHRAAAVVYDDGSAAPTRHVRFLQADGTWCAVSTPIGGVYHGTMAWNENGDMLIGGSQVRHGDVVVWHATGVRCGE